VHGRVSESADAILNHVAAALGCSRTDVIDCVLRGLTLDEITTVVRSRLRADERARAAWNRSRM
jgi:hypothetical protein